MLWKAEREEGVIEVKEIRGDKLTFGRVKRPSLTLDFELNYIRNPSDELLFFGRIARLEHSVCLISFTPPCDGGNILVFPVDGSHWINMKILLEELHTKGHSITVMRASNSWYISEKSPVYKSITIEMDVGFENFFEVYLQEHMRAQREGASALTFFKLTKDFMSMISQAHSLWSEVLIKIFDDENMVKSLKDSQFDLVLTDPAMAPGVLLAKYLKLPVVLNVRWITSGEGHFALAPSPVSYIPVPGSGLTDKMNFLQRVKNILFYSVIVFQQKFLVGPTYDAICDEYIQGGCDILSLLQEADIWLFRSDFERGAGKIIQLADVNGHNFEQGINKVLYHDSYRQNMQRLSRLHRDQPIAPMDQAIFWVEYVMRNKGAPHLRTEAYKMPWYAYYCLDVLLLLLTAATVLLLSTVAMFRFLCCRARTTTKTKQH
ncbi:hypothetical protein FQN60_000712 [Etheostoma spectabile]|uniref:Uncharacterized protein n=1 Tax=Etheostoma spectabile TaxID=54343 RepID=A0A5J5D2E8_9PERO|nr:hypothetical protein FQN60_000712 [Etheostoma spectabile]